jgi:hypothetical protein
MERKHNFHVLESEQSFEDLKRRKRSKEDSSSDSSQLTLRRKPTCQLSRQTPADDGHLPPISTVLNCGFIKLLPSVMVPVISSLLFSFPKQCGKISDELILNRLRFDLGPIFHQAHLEALDKCIPWSTLEYIYRYWIWSGGYRVGSNEHDMLMKISAECLHGLGQFLPESRTTMAFLVGKYASFGMLTCWVRIDEDSRSVCSGPLAFKAQFLFISILDTSRGRVYFHHPIDATIIFMDLYIQELCGLESRLLFRSPNKSFLPQSRLESRTMAAQDEEAEPPAWIWSSSAGLAKHFWRRASYTVFIPRGVSETRPVCIKIPPTHRRQILV